MKDDDEEADLFWLCLWFCPVMVLRRDNNRSCKLRCSSGHYRNKDIVQCISFHLRFCLLHWSEQWVFKMWIFWRSHRFILLLTESWIMVGEKGGTDCTEMFCICTEREIKESFFYHLMCFKLLLVSSRIFTLVLEINNDLTVYFFSCWASSGEA